MRYGKETSRKKNNEVVTISDSQQLEVTNCDQSNLGNNDGVDILND